MAGVQVPGAAPVLHGAVPPHHPLHLVGRGQVEVFQAVLHEAVPGDEGPKEVQASEPVLKGLPVPGAEEPLQGAGLVLLLQEQAIRVGVPLGGIPSATQRRVFWRRRRSSEESRSVASEPA